MGNRGLAALYRALNRPTGPHLDDETLAAVVDAELAGENVDLTFKNEMEHIESCEKCALAYSDLLLTMREIVGDMALEAGAASPVEAYTAFLQAEIQKKAGELAHLPELVNYLVTGLARQLTSIPAGQLPDKVPADLIQQSPFAAALSAETVKTITSAVVRNTAALATFLMGQAAVIWNRSFPVTAEADKNKFCLTLGGAFNQIGEPKATYNAADERLLTQLALPDSALQLKAHLARQTTLTCRLIVQLQGAQGAAAAGSTVYIRYYPVEKSAETDETGQAYFDDVPIAVLPELKILILREG